MNISYLGITADFPGGGGAGGNPRGCITGGVSPYEKGIYSRGLISFLYQEKKKVL